MKKALITGITGQDGSYLAELLLEKGYEVHGTTRRSSTSNTKNIDHLEGQISLHYADLTDGINLGVLLSEIQPDEIYNLAAQSHVRVSFDKPVYTGNTVGLGVARLLEAMRHFCPKAKMYQASTSEMFGGSPPPQNETSPFHPLSPYGIAKLYAYWMCLNYRDSYNLFISNGILFNHESPRRSENILSKKVTKAAARIHAGLQDELLLGNLEAKRDWGYAKEYVEAMWLMLQQDKPDDFVVGTGETHSVQEFVEEAFNCLGLDWTMYVNYRKDLLRPSEVNILQADNSKTKKVLGWEPKTTFKELVKGMVFYDSREASREERK
ncbi:hypothetical protein LCGC14_0902220 [marine sediment metagenome]|uniref:GDP-mannose 4,6-dehydratase n=1 Tax=marine sediment metagenome TaxID=412755 RepID=A0A0F9PGR9_9ZZZZ